MAAQVSQLVVDSLISLVDAEEDSLLNRLRESPPALAGCPASARQILYDLDTAHRARDRELRNFLSSHAMPAPPHHPPEADPMFDLLSSRFLLLKVAEAQDLLRLRYHHALSTITQHPDGATFQEACSLVDRHLQSIADDYARLAKELRALGMEPEQSN